MIEKVLTVVWIVGCMISLGMEFYFKYLYRELDKRILTLRELSERYPGYGIGERGILDMESFEKISYKKAEKKFSIEVGLKRWLRGR